MGLFLGEKCEQGRSRHGPKRGMAHSRRKVSEATAGQRGMKPGLNRTKEFTIFGKDK